MSQPIDISPRAKKTIKELLQRYLPGVTVWAYGSRVKWTARPESDLDLVVFAGKEQRRDVANLREAFEESNLPFRVDVFIWDEVPERFREEIREEIREEYVVVRGEGEKDWGMGGNWQEKGWGDLATLEYGRALRDYKDANGKYRVYGTNGPVGWTDEPLCSTAGIIIGRKGAYRGVHFSQKPFFVIDTAFYLKPKEDFNIKWAYYQLLTQDINSMDSGSAIPSTSRDEFYSLPVRLPPRIEQDKIADILSTLDDKIELNRQINKTLEATAQAIFKSWFVDFDPVKVKQVAKALGCDPERAAMAALSGKLSVSKNTADLSVDDFIKAEAELDQLVEEDRKQLVQTAALFPDGFVESELDLIPEGWEVKKLKNITNKIGSGATPRGGGKAYVEEGIAFIRSQNVHDCSFLWSGLVRMTDRDAEKLKGVTVEEEDVLINITGDSILRTCVVDSKVLPARVNQHVSIIRASHPIPARYLHLYLVRPEIKNLLLGFDAGGSRKAITKGHLESLPVTIPPATVLLYFQNLIENMYKRVEANNDESRCLSSIRDNLLPKLLSGEIDLCEAEAQTEKAHHYAPSFPNALKGQS